MSEITAREFYKDCPAALKALDNLERERRQWIKRQMLERNTFLKATKRSLDASGIVVMAYEELSQGHIGAGLQLLTGKN